MVSVNVLPESKAPLVTMKGAPERVLARCDRALIDGKIVALEGEVKARIEQIQAQVRACVRGSARACVRSCFHANIRRRVLCNANMMAQVLDSRYVYLRRSGSAIVCRTLDDTLVLSCLPVAVVLRAWAGAYIHPSIHPVRCPRASRAGFRGAGVRPRSVSSQIQILR